MTNLFFYGSLRDKALLRIVLGDDDANIELIDANLADHKICWVKDQGFPIVLHQVGETAQGLLAKNLTDDHIKRLNFYEGGFAYDLVPAKVSTPTGQQNCEIYWPPENQYQAGDPWHLIDWQQKWGDLSRLAAIEAMSYFGDIDADTLQRRFNMIRGRAASKLRAMASPSPVNIRAGMTSNDVIRDIETRSHIGFYALDTLQLRHRKFNGEMSEQLTREVFIGGDATIVLPYDPVADKILLVEQFRMGPTGRHDPTPWCLEPVAGLIDPGDDPEETAYREAKEEANLDLRSLEFVSKGYPSPGASAEFFHLYIGLCTLPETAPNGGGLASEGEDIRSHILSFDEAMRHVDTGEINVIPTVLCLNWLARHRDRIRAGS